MKTSRFRLGYFVVLLSVALISMPAGAVIVGAGWTQSDVGLHADGEGFYLSVGNDLQLDNPVLDARYSLDYVQKKGSQPTHFVDPLAGFFVEDAEVTLHVLQPSVFLGAKVPGLPVVPRLYIGGSIGLKLKESWSDFPGLPDRTYGYKETDMVLHVGTSVGVGPVTLDLRWSKSMIGQLILDPQLVQVTKASDLLPGVSEPETGFKTEVLQVGIEVNF